MVIPVRVSESMAEAIDAARGSVGRSPWFEKLAAEVLGETVHEKAKPGISRTQDSADCPPHPKGRVIKGFCYRCGKPAS